MSNSQARYRVGVDVGGTFTDFVLVDEAREVLPRDTIATCDAGASRLLVVQKWLSFGPREFLASNGLGSMGYAVPGALAARLAWPDRPAVAFAGDGGLLMAVAELQTSVRENLPIIVVVFDDEEIGLIRVKQEIKGIARFAGIQAGIDGYDAAILLNSRGKVAEAQGMCLFLIRDGVAVTPSVTSDILESITRDTVLTLLRDMGIDARERDVDRSEFFAASEAFFCGTGWEITPINAVDGAPIGTGRPGEVTRTLQKAYFDLVYGVSGDRPEWISEA